MEDKDVLEYPLVDQEDGIEGHVFRMCIAKALLSRHGGWTWHDTLRTTSFLHWQNLRIAEGGARYSGLAHVWRRYNRLTEVLGNASSICPGVAEGTKRVKVNLEPHQLKVCIRRAERTVYFEILSDVTSREPIRDRLLGMGVLQVIGNRPFG